VSFAGCDRACPLVIDCNRAVYGDRPLPLWESIEQWPASCGLAAWEAIEPTQRLEAARTAGLLVDPERELRSSDSVCLRDDPAFS
jgi:hypothetical protein